MFGFLKKNFSPKSNIVKDTIIKSEIVNESSCEYYIRAIYLVDGYNQWIDNIKYRVDPKGTYLDEHGILIPDQTENSLVVKEPPFAYHQAAYGWTKNGNPTKIRIYFLYENNDSGLGFHYGCWEWNNDNWEADDTINRIKFYDGQSKIVYRYVTYMDYCSNGETKQRNENILTDVLLNRETAFPMV